MTTMSTEFESNEAEYLRYRSLSLLAVAAFALFIFSLAALIFPFLLVLPALGVMLGFAAVRSIRNRPQELAGGGLAWFATVGCLLILVAGTAITATIYATEVPEGYQRINFLQLQPDQSSRLPVPEFATELDGQQVFVKGYVYPDERGKSLKQFVLVPDMGTCCFGGQPKLTDMIEVTLSDPLRTQYSYRRHKLGGTLRVDTKLKPITGLEGVYYRLECDFMNGEFAEGE